MDKERNRYAEFLKEFLKDKERHILLLKGEWGIGKTYFWKNFIKENFKEFGFKAYSYVSLFGIKEFEQIKENIFSKTLDLGKDKKFNDSGVFSSLFEMAKEAPGIREWKGVLNGSLNFLLNNYLICFDDIERKNPNIRMADFLGLCNQLGEESNCKIVIIFNENALENKDSGEFAKYREKTIDKELLFRPSIKDNFDLIFTDHQKYQDILSQLQKHNISNLRIMKHIKSNIDFFDRYLENVLPSTKKFFYDKISFLTVFLLLGDKKFENYETKDILSSLDDSDGSNIIETKTEFLSKYEYFYENEDYLIIEYIQNYIFEEEEFRKFVENVNEEEKESGINKKISEIWTIYKSNFSVDKDDFKIKIETVIRENSRYIKFEEFRQLLNFLEYIEKTDSIQELLNVYYKDRKDLLSTNELNAIKELSGNNSFIENVEKQIEEVKSNLFNYTIKEVIYQVAFENSWNPLKTKALANYSEYDYYKWLISEKDDRLLYALSSFMKTFNSRSTDPEHKIIGEKLENSLKRVAKTDPLRKVQIKNLLRIKVDE